MSERNMHPGFVCEELFLILLKLLEVGWSVDIIFMAGQIRISVGVLHRTNNSNAGELLRRLKGF